MMTKSELERYRHLRNRIDGLNRELENLPALSAVNGDGQPKGNKTSDPTFQRYAKIESLKERIEFLKNQAVDELNKIHDFIESVEDVEMQDLLTERYINGLTFKQIGDKKGYDGSTVRKKINVFLNFPTNPIDTVL